MNSRPNKKLALLLFRSFGLASAYSFLSAIMIGLSLNLFVSVRLARDLQHFDRSILYLAVFSLMLAAFGFFSVAWNLENARNQWIEEGALKSEASLVRPIRVRLIGLYVSVAIGIGGGSIGFLLIACN